MDSGQEARPPGPAEAAKAVAADVNALVRAEIDLAKAEVAAGARAKATGMALVVAAAALGWLALQALLVAAGLALALVLPGWAAALVVGAGLLVLALVLALPARGLLARPVSVDQAKAQATEDAAWVRARLSAPRTTAQLRSDARRTFGRHDEEAPT